MLIICKPLGPASTVALVVGGRTLEYRILPYLAERYSFEVSLVVR